MRSDSDSPAEDVVYLLAELRCDGKRSVLEIGSRARVIDSDGDRLTLAVAHGGGGEDIVTCSRALVARRERSLTGRRTLRPSSRPAY